MDNVIEPPSSIKFHCDNCYYHTIRKSQYERHLLTTKHKNAIKYYDLNFTSSKQINFDCICGKSYPYRASLHNHKKKCDFQEKQKQKLENQIIKDNEGDIDYKEMFLKILDENKELRTLLVTQQSQISELIPKVGNNNNNTINKQKFNINFFLNEQCKDAITMNKFIDNIKVSLEDLFVTKNKGISEGISNIFIKNMNKLSLYERPIHCTDVKRETVYIKSEGENGSETQWEKDKEKDKLKKVIDDIGYAQSKNLKLYTDQNPDWMEKEHKQDEYMVMVKNCLDDIKENNREDKVIKKVCNNVYIKNNAT
jgi:hypothetical protein